MAHSGDPPGEGKVLSLGLHTVGMIYLQGEGTSVVSSMPTRFSLEKKGEMLKQSREYKPTHAQSWNPARRRAGSDSEELDKAPENKKSMAKMNKKRVSKSKQEAQPGVGVHTPNPCTRH